MTANDILCLSAVWVWFLLMCLMLLLRHDTRSRVGRWLNKPRTVKLHIKKGK